MKAIGADAQQVFAGPKTIVYLTKGDKLDEKVVKDALGKHKIKLKSMKRDDSQIL